MRVTMGLNKLIVLFCFSGLLTTSAIGQIDSSGFEPEVFQSEDLLIREMEEGNRISAANRVLESADELPVRTIIISKAEIRRNGFTTLVDVLKTLPGFRTSQPGSAQLGETFLMRGLVGNIYTKILVNGIPIEPSAAPGMPLSAQLPIQAADRIEIILGPAGSVFGADAMAGVINIVMAEVDRPIEAYGGASLGSQNTSYLHLSLGGKLGEAKNVIDYNFYAASWSRDDINFLWKNDDLKKVNYSIVDNNPYWKGDPKNDSLAAFREMPQRAQMVGLSLGFRGFTYNFQYMSRQDPSALGSYLTDVAYTNSNSFTADNVQTHQLRFQKSKKRVDFTTNLSGIIYELDENSSYDGIAHPISADRNFIYAYSNDVQLEQLINFRPGDKDRWNILLGVNASYNEGNSWQNYLRRPFGPGSAENNMDNTEFIIENSATDSLSNIETFSLYNDFEDFNYAAFGQVYYRAGKWKLIGGARYDRQSHFGDDLSPMFGFFYKQNKNLRFRGRVAKGFRAPGNYYVTNNYRGAINPVDSSFGLSRFEANLEPETMTNVEVGSDIKLGKNWDASIHSFYHIRKQNIIPKLLTPDDLFGQDPDDGPGGPGGPPPVGGGEPDENTAGNYEIGFYNANSKSELLGMQAFLNYDNQDWLRAELFGQVNLGTEFVEFEKVDSLGEEDTKEVRDSSFSEMPDVMGGLNLHFKFGKGFHLSVYTKVFSEYRWALQVVNDSLLVKPSNGGYYNIDAVASADLGKRLTFYVRMNNVTGSTNKGIYTNSLSGYQFPYIPQPGRTLLAGLTFDLNRKEEER